MIALGIVLATWGLAAFSMGMWCMSRSSAALALLLAGMVIGITGLVMATPAPHG